MSEPAQLDLKRMLVEIDNLVETDFIANMELQQLPNSRPYTQAEALEMSRSLSLIYSISHCLHCQACQMKYLSEADLVYVTLAEIAKLKGIPVERLRIKED